MEVDSHNQAAMAQKTQNDSLTMQFNSSAARSIEHLAIQSQETDQILIGFASGKIMQLCLDLGHVKQIIDGESPSFLDFQAYVESRLTVESKEPAGDMIGQGHEDLNMEQSGPFWGA